MTIESATGIWDLDPSLPSVIGPTGVGDPIDEGDDHTRLIKATITYSFTNVAGQVIASHTEMNYLVGVTSAIQTQLDAKLETADITKALVDALGVDAATLDGTYPAEFALLASADFTALQVGGTDVATQTYADAAGAAAAPEVGSWVDVQNPLTSVNSSATVAHGLAGGKPDLLLFRLVCLSDDNGYTTGDELELGTSTSSDGAPCWEGDATNITVRWRDLRLTATDGSAAPNPGVSNDWKLQAKGIKF